MDPRFHGDDGQLDHQDYAIIADYFKLSTKQKRAGFPAL